MHCTSQRPTMNITAYSRTFLATTSYKSEYRYSSEFGQTKNYFAKQGVSTSEKGLLSDNEAKLMGRRYCLRFSKNPHLSLVILLSSCSPLK